MGPIHRKFQEDFSEGSITVHVLFEFNSDMVSNVIGIITHGNSESGIPGDPRWEFENGKYYLIDYYTKAKNGESARVMEVIDNEYSRVVVESIEKLIQENKPNFSN
jgi:hypothetical protein